MTRETELQRASSSREPSSDECSSGPRQPALASGTGGPFGAPVLASTSASSGLAQSRTTANRPELPSQAAPSTSQPELAFHEDLVGAFPGLEVSRVIGSPPMPAPVWKPAMYVSRLPSGAHDRLSISFAESSASGHDWVGPSWPGVGITTIDAGGPPPNACINATATRVP